MAQSFARFGFAPKRLATVAVLATAAAAGGCGHASLTPLPDLAELPIEKIDAGQKEAAIKEMAEMRVEHESRAISAIEKAR